MTRKLLIGFGVMVVAAVVASCGPIVELPNSGPAPSLYTLTSPDVNSAQGSSDLLLVEDPGAASGLDLTLLARRSSPTAVQYYAGARWADRPTVMLQQGLVEGFEQAGQNVSSGRGGTAVPAVYELQTEVRDFQAEFYNGGTIPEVRVRLSLTLIRLGKLETVGHTSVEVTRSAAGPTLDDAVLAFNDAASQAMAQAVNWTVEQIAASR